MGERMAENEAGGPGRYGKGIIFYSKYDGKSLEGSEQRNDTI